MLRMDHGDLPKVNPTATELSRRAPFRFADLYTVADLLNANTDTDARTRIYGYFIDEAIGEIVPQEPAPQQYIYNRAHNNLHDIVQALTFHRFVAGNTRGKGRPEQALQSFDKMWWQDNEYFDFDHAAFEEGAQLGQAGR